MTFGKQEEHNTTKRRSREPSAILAFEPPLTAAGLRDIPGDCLCTWATVGGTVADGGHWALKFANDCCPYRRHTGGL